MFIVLLEFSGNKDAAAQFAEGHKAWLQRGFDDGVFLLAGSILPRAGGAIVAYNTALADLQARVGEDPFVTQDVVAAKVLEIAPARTDERLRFLLG